MTLNFQKIMDKFGLCYLNTNFVVKNAMSVLSDKLFFQIKPDQAYSNSEILFRKKR